MIYNYSSAVSRNIGWVTGEEQSILSNAKIAIGGLGGVGGAYLLTLARLGIGCFSIADFDQFEIQNFNRQVGAVISTLGQPKVHVLAGMARDINPDVRLVDFAQGVTAENIDAFLEGVDIYVDGIDFFAMEARRMIFEACYRKKIPALTAAPLGMGVSLLYFSPDGMSFEKYFRLSGVDQQEQFARFIAGLSPAMLQRAYLVESGAVDFLQKRGPSTMMACDLCAGVMGTSVLKLLLGRGRLRPAPWGLQFDAYEGRLCTTWRPWGNANPLQWLLLKFIRPKLRGVV